MSNWPHKQDQQCTDCELIFPENEINGHVCKSPNYDNYVKEQRYMRSHEDLINKYPSGMGIKNDQEKPDLSLVPRELLEETAKAFTYGAMKYGRYNFRAGMDHHRILAAAMRHLVAYNEGEDLDPESGLSHLGHAAASIGMLLVLIRTGSGKDTRFKKVGK